MFWNRSKKSKKKPFLKIVSDAGIANPLIGDGRLIPMLTLDCTDIPELTSFLELHQEVPPGDVTSTWAIPKRKKKSMYLFLDFTKPSELSIAIEFPIREYFIVIDGIIQSRALYIRSSDSSERFVQDVDAPALLLEIPEGTTPPYWEELYLKTVIQKIKDEGFSSKQAKTLAVEHLNRAREIWGKRMNRQ